MLCVTVLHFKGNFSQACLRFYTTVLFFFFWSRFTELAQHKCRLRRVKHIQDFISIISKEKGKELCISFIYILCFTCLTRLDFRRIGFIPTFVLVVRIKANLLLLYVCYAPPSFHASFPSMLRCFCFATVASPLLLPALPYSYSYSLKFGYLSSSLSVVGQDRMIGQDRIEQEEIVLLQVIIM